MSTVFDTLSRVKIIVSLRLTVIDNPPIRKFLTWINPRCAGSFPVPCFFALIGLLWGNRVRLSPYNAGIR